MSTPQETQIGGTHYKDMAIQPIEFITKNDIGYCEGNVIKYVTRHQLKGGREDLLKARHYIDLLIQSKYPDQSQKHFYVPKQKPECMDMLYPDENLGPITGCIPDNMKPRTATENRESLDSMFKWGNISGNLSDQTEIQWHNPENVTQEQLGEGYRFLAKHELDGRFSGIIDCWCANNWVKYDILVKGIGVTCRVPKDTLINR